MSRPIASDPIVKNVPQRPLADALIRENILQLPAYVAGKSSADPHVIKVASNEMPFDTLPAVRDAIQAELLGLNRYPDAGTARLIGAIAEYIGVAPECIGVGNGSVALIEKIVASVAGAGDHIVMPWRSFEAYPIAIRMAGAHVVAVPLRADGNCDLEAMLAAVTPQTRAILVCTPNNPTSAALTHTELHEFLANVPPRTVVLLDEAYVDFITMDDPVRGLELIQEFPHVLLLRTFSKAYGLAGLRCGFVVGERSLIGALHSALTPFGVSSLAQVASVAALSQRAEVDRRVGQIVAQRDVVVTALRKLGWKGPDPQGNFVWFELGSEAEKFDAVCVRHGIIVRTFKDEGTRVTIAEPEASERLIAAYEEWVKSGGDADE